MPVDKLKLELEELLNAEPFTPFVVTSADGFAIAVNSPKRALVGLRMLVVSDENGRLYHFPFTGIAHISEAKAA
jgi:hypothetical protein